MFSNNPSMPMCNIVNFLFFKKIELPIDDSITICWHGKVFKNYFRYKTGQNYVTNEWKSHGHPVSSASMLLTKQSTDKRWHNVMAYHNLSDFMICDVFSLWLNTSRLYKLLCINMPMWCSITKGSQTHIEQILSHSNRFVAFSF